MIQRAVTLINVYAWHDQPQKTVHCPRNQQIQQNQSHSRSTSRIPPVGQPIFNNFDLTAPSPSSNKAALRHCRGFDS